MNKFVGDFLSHGPHEIPVDLKESEILVVGAGGQRVDLDGIRAPVSKKSLEHIHRQLARHQLLHKGGPVHLNLPSFSHLPIKLIDNGLGLLYRSSLS